MPSPVIFRVIWREYLSYSLVFTLISCYFVFILGPAGLVNTFWIKWIGFIFVCGYIYLFRRKYLYLFFNLGMGKRHITGLFLATDCILTGSLCLIILVIRSFQLTPAPL